MLGYANGNPYKDFQNVVLFGDHTLSLFRPMEPFLLSSDGLKIIGSNFLRRDYLYVLLQKYMPNNEGYKRHFSILCNERVNYTDDRIEQGKIALLFETIDEIHDATDCEIRILKKYKKGLQKMLYSTNIVSYKRLKDLVSFQPKSKYGAGAGISRGQYTFYLSGDKSSFLNQCMLDGCYVVANDGGEANFKITNGKFSYSDHCICFKGYTDIMTNYIYNYLDMKKDEITYIGFVGSGLKNIDREYFENLAIPIIDEKNIVKYSNLFRLVDDYIDACAEKVEKINSIKKYLLKTMFI